MEFFIAIYQERNIFGKPQQKSKNVQAQKIPKQEVEYLDKENNAVDVMVRQSKAMSICENEPIITREVKAMSICEVIPPTVHDIDKESEKDPFQYSEYAADIYNYLRRVEVGQYLIF